jgi:succinyl-diaminopimelate desuccinylase
MARFIERVQSLEMEAPPHENLGPPTVNIGVIRGGEHPVIIPEACEILIDIRTVPGLDPSHVTHEFKKVAGNDVSIETVDVKPSVSTDENHPFVKYCINACESVLSQRPTVTGVPYYTDGTVLAPALDVPMVIIGPGETGLSGAIDEFVEIDKLHKAIRIYIRIAEDYLG